MAIKPDNVVKPPSMIRPVRVSYFDPRTGEPCAEKPKPLTRKRATAPVDMERLRKDKEAERIEAEREGFEIADGMRRRKNRERRRNPNRKPLRNPGRSGRVTLVDGVEFKTAKLAADSIGAALSTVCNRCRDGGGMVKGHEVRYKEELEWK